MQRKHTIIFTMFTLFALLLAACGGGQEAESTATPAPATETSVPPTATAAPTNTPAPTNTAEPAAEPTDTPADEAAAGEADSTAPSGLTEDAFALPGVDSYRSRMSISVSGEAFQVDEGDGEGLNAQELLQGFEITGEHTKEPPAHHITVKLGGETFAETIQISNTTWVKSPMFGGDSWMQSDSQDDMVSSFTPDIFTASELEDVANEFEEVGTEEINGIEVTHYRADKDILSGLMDLQSETDLAQLNQADTAQMDMYISNEGVLVKWTMKIEGTGLNDQKPDAQGSMDISVELYDFNADDISIEAPEAPSASDTMGFEVPMPEGATQTFSMQGMTSFEVSGTTIDDLASFYQEEMANLGFEYNDSNSMTSGEFASLNFSGNDMEVAINITTGDGEDAPLQVIVQTDQMGAGSN